MIGWLRSSLCKIAKQVLPARGEPWGAAMEAELDYIDDDRAAISYAAGCLIAAIQERARDFETRFAVGLWSIALASTAFALFHIVCGARGVQVLLGRPDGFLHALVASGRADAALIANYQSAMPIVIFCFFCLGAAHLAAAYFLFRRHLRGFLIAWGSGFVCAVAAVSIQLSIVPSDDTLPSEFIGLLVQAAALLMLLLWSSQQHYRSGREA